MSTIRKQFKVDGTLVDPTSIVLSDSNAAYGARRTDTNAVVVAANTAMTRVSTGVYEYEFDDPESDLQYEYWVKIVYDGTAYYFDGTLTGESSPPSADEAKRRYQAVHLGDTLLLEFYSYNGNRLSDVLDIEKVEVYHLNQFARTQRNPDGRELIVTVLGADVDHYSAGHYGASVFVDPNTYPVGDFVDVWYVKYTSADSDYRQATNTFKTTTDLRETSGSPFARECDFSFSPKKIQLGSKKLVQVNFALRPPADATDLEKFYFTSSQVDRLYVRTIVHEGANYVVGSDNVVTDPEWAPIEVRGDGVGYFEVDATESGNYGIGIHAVQFKALVEGEVLVSPKFWLQVID